MKTWDVIKEKVLSTKCRRKQLFYRWPMAQFENEVQYIFWETKKPLLVSPIEEAWFIKPLLVHQAIVGSAMCCQVFVFYIFH